MHFHFGGLPVEYSSCCFLADDDSLTKTKFSFTSLNSQTPSAFARLSKLYTHSPRSYF